MLPGFLPQSTPPAPPPAGGGLPAAPGADAVNAPGEAFTSALDSACDAQSPCAEPAESHAADKPGPGTSPRLAAWLLALARRGNPVADANASEQATQQAPPFPDEDGVELPVIGDRKDAETAVVAEAGNAGDAASAFIAPLIESVPVAEVPVPQAVATSPDVPVTELSDDKAGTVAGGSEAVADAADAGQASGWRSAPDAVSRNGLSASDRDAQANRAESNGRSQQAPPVNDAGTRLDAIAPAAESIDGAGGGAPGTSSDVEGAQSQSPSSDRLQTADARVGEGHRPASAGSSSHVSSASQGATGTATVSEPGTVANLAGAQTVQGDATAAAVTETGDVRAVTTAVNASADDASQTSAHRSVSSATAAQGASHGGNLQGNSSQGSGSQGGSSQSGASLHDAWRQIQDAEGAGRPRGLDVAGTRTAAAAMLMLVAGPDGALRLTPAAMAAPVLPPLLQQDQTANIDQLVQTMRVMVKDQVTEATVHLRPRHFGEVSIQVRIDGKSVAAIIHTESSQVRDWMLGQEGTLRNGLSEQGLTLERLVVQRDGRQDRRDHTQQQPERRRQRQRQQSDSQQTFELTA